MSKQLFYIKQDRELQRFTLHGVTLNDVTEALSLARPMIICRTDMKGMRQSSRTRFRYIEAHERYRITRSLKSCSSVIWNVA